MNATIAALTNSFDTAPVTIEPTRGLFHLRLRDIWLHRELLYFLVWRDVKVRYKQTAIGVVWVILQPLLTMLIFTVVFGRFARIPSEGVPYPLFAIVGLLPWLYFSSAVMRSAISVVAEADVIRKVYFPRLIIPASALLAALVDLAIGLLIVFVMLSTFGFRPTWSVLTLPVFTLLAVANALGIGLWLSALNVRYRDVGHTIPFLMQCWMYASPVVYPVSIVPVKWRYLYDLNPMVGVLAGFRWALLATDQLEIRAILTSTAIMCTLLVSGLVVFKYMERTFVDVI
jgi:lipopolysaccharide transport system permease protein